jgi:transcriptional regulator with PAS, ATPase and Fis domain
MRPVLRRQRQCPAHTPGRSVARGVPLRHSGDAPARRLAEFLHTQERERIRQAPQRHDFQIGVTADALGISRKSLCKRMKRPATC